MGDVAREDGFAITDERAPPGWKGPLHHHEHDEAVYVLAGAVTVEVGGERVVAEERRCAFVPGGLPHAIANLGSVEARWLAVCTPPPAADIPLGRSARDGAARPVEEVRGRVKVLVRGGDGSGRVAIVDTIERAGHDGPPLHHHPFDEAFYVLDGVLTFRLDERDVTCRPGELAFAPGGTPHTFANRGEADARMLIVCVPAGFERYFERIAAGEAGGPPPPEDVEAWPEITVVGPRIGESAG